MDGLMSLKLCLFFPLPHHHHWAQRNPTTIQFNKIWIWRKTSMLRMSPSFNHERKWHFCSNQDGKNLRKAALYLWPIQQWWSLVRPTMVCLVTMMVSTGKIKMKHQLLIYLTKVKECNWLMETTGRLSSASITLEFSNSRNWGLVKLSHSPISTSQ